jgi:hypothetical protein
MRWAATLVVLASCWTGDVPEPAQPASEPAPKPRLTYAVKMTRTRCFGHCPAYTVEIDRDGNVKWAGEDYVQVTGDRRAKVPLSEVRRLARAIDKLHFFNLDDSGNPRREDCTREPDGTLTCSTFVSFCSDTSHAVITVTRGGKAHTVDDAHCHDNPTLDDLEQLIDTVAGTREWIGR